MAKPSDKAPKPKVAAKESAQSGANLGFEAKLWLTADKLRNNMDAAEYKHVAGFCKSATTEEMAGHGHVLTPGRYVGSEEVEDDGEPFAEKMSRLVTELNGQFAGGGEAGEDDSQKPRGVGLWRLACQTSASPRAAYKFASPRAAGRGRRAKRGG